MNEESFPLVQQFIRQNIESLGQLEALLLLHQDAERAWTTDELAKSLYLTPQMAAVLLLDLARRGYASSSESAYRYVAKDVATEKSVDALARIYRERRVAVITEIYSKPLNKVQTFADAFRLRKEE